MQTPDLQYFAGLLTLLCRVMNGVKMEIDEPLQSAGTGLTCCLIENGIRCHRPTGNASYSKRIAKTVTQRRLKLVVDQSVSCIRMFVSESFAFYWNFISGD